ncbi:hypothetical protein EDD86DRAFT_268992 [Gorgonomyces haynaldii]|nr:hypothetical protein EDD86DRAFT_268992 [Gorgonomyces haynaldii]
MEPLKLSLPTLHEMSAPSRSNKNRIKRPCNAFILYRRYLCQSLRNANGTEISKEAAQRWAQEAPEVRRHFIMLAEQERREHMEKYPDFKWYTKPKDKRKTEEPPSPEQEPATLRQEPKLESSPKRTDSIMNLSNLLN